MNEDKCFYIETFGNFKIKYNDIEINMKDMRGKKVWALFKYLVIHRNTSTNIDDMYEVFCEASDNPSNSLKNLIYRLKNALYKLGLPQIQYIKFKDGMYMWNKEIDCIIDCEEFEKSYNIANNNIANINKKIDLYNKAIQMYNGYFLSSLSYEKWVIPISRFYHNIYIECALKLCNLLTKQKKYDDIINVCAKVISFDNLQEDIYFYYINAFIKKNHHQDALKIYNDAQDLFYNELGVVLSKETRNLYSEIIVRINDEERNLLRIQEDLLSGDDTLSAYFCEYEIFKNIYKVYSRVVKRSKQKICILLFTMTDLQDQIPTKEVLIRNMQLLQDVIFTSLRKGDVVSRFSSTQFVIMLANIQTGDCELIIKRLTDLFYKKDKSSQVKIHSKYAWID